MCHHCQSWLPKSLWKWGKLGTFHRKYNPIGPLRNPPSIIIFDQCSCTFCWKICRAFNWGVKRLLRIEIYIYIYIYIFRTWTLPIWPVLVEVFNLFNTTSCTLHKKTCHLHTSIPQVLFRFVIVHFLCILVPLQCTKMYPTICLHLFVCQSDCRAWPLSLAFRVAKAQLILGPL